MKCPFRLIQIAMKALSLTWSIYGMIGRVPRMYHVWRRLAFIEQSLQTVREAARPDSKESP